MLIDTHTHLDFSDFDPDRESVIRRAVEAGVGRIIAIGTNLQTSRAALQLAERHAEIYATIGIHPNEVMESPDDAISQLEQMANHPKIAAIGECGLDYHSLPSSRKATFANLTAAIGSTSPGTESSVLADADVKNRQAIFFQEQLDLAVRIGCNVVIHQRDSWADTLNALRPYTGRLRGVFHCFSGDTEQACHILELGHAISFTGIVTFKNAGTIQEVAKRVPLGSFFVETDCPYLAPEPDRGKRCEPAHTRQVAEKIAALRSLSLQEISRATTEAAEKFFRFR
ncbi:MAG: TatD family deoxyribonuclease [Verrucomicrobia bacterium]|nr:TatD family deoxyribonuclease [Verrucomicrobiota bacterium]NBU68176.1 TatD family deoxyribonuclease [Verrucomicrobiota bacterium]NDB99945.1 TatD family deoxyribonuclease [Verrucomicrobiota bacterium]NDF16399.1 TatD family deoxyribonuclease [Verrucomicrobiota bacterium]